MEDRKQANPNKPRPHLQFTCPTCKRRVKVVQEDPSRLPRFFPFCCERCKLIDLGAWLDAQYRISAKPDEESEHPMDADSPAQ
jgi:hypothetical protein